MHDVGRKTVQFCRGQAAYVAIQVGCIWKVVAVYLVGSGIEVKRRNDVGTNS